MALFSVLDYIIFFATVCISLCIGLFVAFWDRKKTTPDDYFLAGRKFRILPAALSFVVTFQSSLMILGTPVETYQYGTVFCYHVIGIVLSYTFAGITAVPVFHTLKLTSVYKYFEIRYQSRVVKNMVMAGAVIYTVFYVATVTYGTCVALELVMGIPFWATILLYTTITTIYTSVGGIKAVIWTDVFQILIMVTGLVAVHVKTTLDTGGSGRILDLASSRFNMDVRFDITQRYNFWNVSAGSFCIFLYCAYAQAGIQRINSTPSIKSGRWLYIISGPIFACIWLLTAFEGVSVFAYYSSKGCDILASKTVENVNGLMPRAILDLFQNIPGMSGLFIASLSSAVLSTLSSCLNSLSAITYDDIVKVIFPDISDKRATFVSKIIVLIYGLIGMGLTFAVSKIPGSVAIIFMAFMGCMEGPTCAIYILSTMFRRSTTPGMVVGGLTGMILTLWISLGRMLSAIPPDPTLPSGPINRCSANASWDMESTMYSNTTDAYLLSTNPWPNNTYSVATMKTSSPPVVQDELTALQEFYSVSVITYSAVGLVTTLIVGAIVSILTKPPKIIDERCLFSVSKHLLNKGDSSERKSSTGEEETREMMLMNM